MYVLYKESIGSNTRLQIDVQNAIIEGYSKGMQNAKVLERPVRERYHKSIYLAIKLIKHNQYE